MLEQIFGSRTRVHLLRIFLDHPGQAYFVRELARLLGTQVYAVRRELENLEGFGLVVAVPQPTDAKASSDEIGSSSTQKRYYALNTGFVLVPELTALFLKARLLIERSLVEKIQSLGSISYLLLSGVFVGLRDWPTDLIIVGAVKRDALKRLITQFERELQQPINYTVMTKAEFQYRREITDRFIFTLLENKHIVVIDKITPPNDRVHKEKG